MDSSSAAAQVNHDSKEVPPNLPGVYKPQRPVLYEDLGADDVERALDYHNILRQFIVQTLCRSRRSRT